MICIPVCFVRKQALTETRLKRDGFFLGILHGHCCITLFCRLRRTHNIAFNRTTRTREKYTHQPPEWRKTEWCMESNARTHAHTTHTYTRECLSNWRLSHTNDSRTASDDGAGRTETSTRNNGRVGRDHGLVEETNSRERSRGGWLQRRRRSRHSGKTHNRSQWRSKKICKPFTRYWISMFYSTIFLYFPVAHETRRSKDLFLSSRQLITSSVPKTLEYIEWR